MRRTNCQRVIFHSPSPLSLSPSANTSICKTLMCKSLHMNHSNPHSPHVTPRIVMYVNVRLCQEKHECLPWFKLEKKAHSSQLVSTLYPKMLSLCRVCSSAAFYIVLFSFLPQSVEITKGRIICRNFLFAVQTSFVYYLYPCLNDPQTPRMLRLMDTGHEAKPPDHRNAIEKRTKQSDQSAQM